MSLLATLVSRIFEQITSTLEELDKLTIRYALEEAGLDKDFIEACVNDENCAKTVEESLELEYELKKREVLEKAGAAMEGYGVHIESVDCTNFEAKDGYIGCDDGEVVINIGGIRLKFTCSEWGKIEVLEEGATYEF